MRNRVMKATACLAMALAMASAGADAQSLTQVKVGSYVTVSDAGLFVAAEKGYFRDQGIEPIFSRLDTGSVVMTSLASKDIDVAGGSPGAGIYNAARQGIDVKMVADKGSARPGFGYISFVTRPDLAGVVKTGADLRGRVMAVTGYFDGATMEVATGRLLKAGNLKEADVKLINMSYSDIVAGLSTGRIEVGVLIEPLTTLAIDRKVAVMWKHLDEVYPNQQAAALMYGPSMTARRELAERFTIAYLQGVRFYNDALSGKAPKAELTSILVKHTAVKDAALYDKMTYPGLNPDGKLNIQGMKDDIAWWVSAGRMKEAIDINKVVDTSYVDAALKKLGKY